MKLTHTVSHSTARLFVTATVAGLLLASTAPRASAQSKSGFTYNGMDYISYSSNEYLEVPAGPNGAIALRATGANYTAVMATWDVQTYDSTDIAPSGNSPTDAAVVAAIQNLQAQGITVTLKPHVDSDDGIWRGEFTWPTSATTTAEKQAWLTAWFTSYEAFILHFAQIASENNVGIMVIGTEFAQLTGNNCAGSCRTYWDQYVITPLRAQYPDLKLVYGANATSAGDEFTTVTFWDDVDIIGVDGYFPVATNSDDPTVAELVEAWNGTDASESGDFDIVTSLSGVASQHNKPLIFSEIGYESTTGSNVAPYNYNVNNAVDDQEQANCYEAFFEVFSQQTSWMKGVFWWDWSVSAPDVTTDTGYSPQGKMAATTTLPEWYGSSTEGFTLAPSLPLMSIGQGLSSTETISVTPLGGFTGTVTLSTSGLPTGVTGVFSAGTVAGTQVLKLTASGTATAGTVQVTVNGISGTMTASTTISLTVQAAVTQTITFTNPGPETVGEPVEFSATATSGLPVSFATTTSTFCNVTTTGSAAFLKVGTCTINTTQAGNGIYSAAAPVSQTFSVNAALPIPSTADVLVSQVNWLASLAATSASSASGGGFGYGAAPEGGSFAVNSNGDIFAGDQGGFQTLWVNGATGAVTVLVNDLSNGTVWDEMSGPVAVDTANNVYVTGINSPYVLKIPYVNGTYTPVTVPAPGVGTMSLSNCAAAANTTTDQTVCLFAAGDETSATNYWPNYSSIAFDPSGNFYFVNTYNTTLTPGVPTLISECNAACETDTAPHSATVLYTDTNWVSSIAFDPKGNLYFTDYTVNSSGYFESSNLNELKYTASSGYATTPVVLQSYTDSPVAQYDEGITDVATDSNGNLYLGYVDSGVYLIPSSNGVPDVSGEYAISTQGAIAVTVDSNDNAYLVDWNATLNNDGVARVTVNNVTVPASPVGTAVSPSTTLNPVNAILNDTACSGSPAPAVTFAANASSTATATVSTTGTCASNALGGSSFAAAVSFTPMAPGADSVTLTGTDQSNHTGTVTVSGVGSGFTLSPSPQALSVAQSGSNTDTITIADGGGFTGTITLAASGLPTGVTASFAAGTVAGTQVLTLTASSSAVVTTSAVPVTITGTSGALTATATVDLSVTPPPSFTLSALPTSVSVAQGSTGTSTITVAGANGFNGTVTLAATGLPSGVTASFAAGTVSGTQVLTLTASGSATVTTSPVTVTINGTSSTLTASTSVNVSVTAGPSFSLSALPTSLSVVQGSTGTSTITVTGANGFSGTVTLAATGLPTGVTASFAAGTVSGTQVLTLTASGTAVVTTSAVTVTIKGTSGTLTASTSVSLSITPAPSFSLTPTASSVTVVQGNNATDTITIGPANGFSGSVTLSATGLPTGVTASFAAGTVSGTQVMTLTASSTATVTTSPVTVTITGISGSLTETSTVKLTVNIAPGFTLSAAPTTVSVVQGSTGTSTVTVTDVGGFTGAVTLAASGLPSGVTASFAAGTVSGTQIVTLTAGATATPASSVTVAINGTSGTLTGSTTISVTVKAAPSFTLSALPTTVSVVQGSTGTSTITVTGANGFTGSVTLAATGLPTGVTASFAAGTVSGTQVLTLTASATATLGGPVTVTINGTSASLSASTTIALTVKPPQSFTLSASPASVTVAEGGSGTSTITVTDVNGYTGSVVLSASGLPSGVTAGFAAGTVSGTQVVTLTANATATLGGPVTVTITGAPPSTCGISCQTPNATTTIALTVVVAPSFTLSASPTSVSIAQGGSGTSTITVTPTGGFSGTVALAASNLPSGVAAGFAAGTAAGTQVVTLTATDSAAVTTSPVTVTITGISGNLTETTSVSLSVTAEPTFTAGSGGTTTLSVTPGVETGNTATIVIAPENGFTGTVNLTCSVTTAIVGDNFPPTCSFSPNPVTFTAGGGSQNSTLTVNTTAPTTAENQMKKMFWPSAGGTALALLFFFGVPRRRRNWLAMIGLLVLFASFGVMGCGGSGGNTGGGGTPGTTAGQYTITVTGTSGSTTATVGTITLTVQ